LSREVGRLWPVSALLSWLLAWFVALVGGWLPGCLFGLLLAALHRRPWRRITVALGLPLALLATGLPLPAWAWLLPLVLLLALYPWWLWRDAPLFLTPADAFDRLAQHMPLSDAARMLDAGSGSGAALRAWHRAYPTLELQGIESSAMLVFWSRWRCPFARIERGDLWTRDWSDFDIVYLFQRPESMRPALDKARAELQPGSRLISLDFELPGVAASLTLPVGRHRLLVYRAEDLN
jgi:hypothetical protein